MKNKNLIFIILCLMGFVAGVYFWRFQHRGRSAEMLEDAEYIDIQSDDHSVFVYVGNKAITMSDVDFEFRAHTDGMIDSNDLTHIPSLSESIPQKLAPLKQRLAASIIERKIMYRFIENDKSFDIDNPSRFTKCLEEWQEISKNIVWIQSNQEFSEKLKSRLCETALIDQYLNEVIFSKIEYSDADLLAYYQKNISDYKQKERVIVRHILAGTESDARKVREGLSSSNFDEKAKEFSIAPEASQGGILGPFAKGQYPALFDVAFSMRVGDISDIIKSDYGFHLIMVTRKLPASVLSFQEAKNIIKEKIAEERKTKVYSELFDRALSFSPVKTPRAL